VGCASIPTAAATVAAVCARRPAEPPFPPTTRVVADAGAGIEITAAVGAAAAEGTFVINGQPADLILRQQRFEMLEARVAVLEAALAARPPGVARESRLPGIGHNLGPAMTAEGEDEIKRLIALLKEQRPGTVVRRDELVAAANGASKVAEKIKQYTDEFFLAAAKKSGEKFGESLFSPVWWLGVAALITSAVGALHSWLEAIPIH
jgi:hypothetical protein